jgi:hypothetical protein
VSFTVSDGKTTSASVDPASMEPSPAPAPMAAAIAAMNINAARQSRRGKTIRRNGTMRR